MNSAFLKEAYSRGSFVDFTKEFLADFRHDEANITLSNYSLFSSAQILGHALDDELSIIEIISEPNSGGGRIAITKEAFSIMRNHGISNALVAFNSGSQEWRLSLLTSNLTLNSKGKVTNISSNPRRYSYLLGPMAKTKTPKQFLIDKGRVSNIAYLQERFSVEVVNNEFYQHVAALYLALIGGDRVALNNWEYNYIQDLTEAKLLETKKDTKYYRIKPLMLYTGTNSDSNEFAVRLIGRIIFCWFLSLKKDSNGISLLPNSVMPKTNLANNYYQSILTPLFFEILNKRLENRKDKYKTGDFALVPYLNGGLFSSDSIDKYSTDDSINEPTKRAIKIHDLWFVELYKLFEKYNFTVDENTSIDSDLSIDPEMLGRVFENLLARINPETNEKVRNTTGSFYTPRDIVDFMVDASLTEYLINQTGINKLKISALVSYNTEDDKGNELDKEQSTQVLNALSNITVLDPACGSGAYPIGVLQKIVYIISILDPDAKWWLNRQLKDASPELKADLSSRSYDYIRKIGIIRKSIYGVDIQPIAVEIAKLRCFLTLLVDEFVTDDISNNRGIKPLPNLDYKIQQGNSLLESYHGIRLFDEELFNDHLSTTNYIESLKLKQLQLQREFFDKDYRKEDTSTVYSELQKIQKALKAYKPQSKSTNIDMFDSEKKSLQLKAALNELNNTYLTESDSVKKHRIKLKIEELQIELIEITLEEVDKKYLIKEIRELHSKSFKPYFLWKLNYPEVFSDGGFDIVIGNPPYINIEKIDKNIKQHIQYFKLAYKKYDIYILFYELGLKLLKDNGTLCYITSNKWLSQEYGKRLREYLLNLNVVSIINFQYNIFESATVDTQIIVINKILEQHNNTKVINIENKKEKNKFTERRYTYIDKDIFKQVPGSNFKLNLTSSKIKLLKKIIDNSITVEDIFSVNYGLRPSSKEDSVHGKDVFIKTENPQGDYKPYIEGKDIVKYNVSNHRYLDYQPEAIYNAMFPELFENTKIVTIRTVGDVNGMRFAYDNNGFYNNDSCINMVQWHLLEKVQNISIRRNINLEKIRNSRAYDLYYCLGALNSKIVKFYFLELFHDGLHFYPNHVKVMPIPILSSEKQKRVIEIVGDLINIINSNPSANIAMQEAEIERIIYELYKLTPEEIALIEQSTKRSN